MQVVNEDSFKTPILFLTFNRLDTVQITLKEIKKIRPAKFYIACDGPRNNVEGENLKVQQLRKYILDNITWDCKVKTLFQKSNIGCKLAVSSGIDWFFKNEKYGIILEDDCLPNESFFRFCEENLKFYENNKKIFHISGVNFQKKNTRYNGDYYFSKIPHIWGWATWANRWASYDVDIKDYGKNESKIKLKNFFKDDKAYKVWATRFDIGYNIDNKDDTWDYQWAFNCFINNGLSITPRINLVSNIGDGVLATHRLYETNLSRVPTYELDFPLTHCHKFEVHQIADDYTMKSQFYLPNLFVRILNKISRIIIKKNII